MASRQERPKLISRLKARFSTRRRAKQDEDAQSKARTIKQMYESFRSILACNDSTLQLIADIEDRLAGRISFSLSQMVRRIRKGILDVYVMVRDFNELAWGRHLDLFEALRKINRDFEADLSTLRGIGVGPLVVPLSHVRATDAHLVGRKMANLGEIKNVLGLDVPDGFAITTVAFSRFMERDGLQDRSEKLEELTETFGPRVVAEACRELQQKILHAPLPNELEEAIWGAYRSLMDGATMLVAMRSSGIAEDEDASHAGLYYTELNIAEGLLLEAYKWVLASTYGAAPVQYRLKYGLASTDSLMAVGCLCMIESKSKGIMFSRSFQHRETDQIIINASPASGKADGGEGEDGIDIIVAAGKIEGWNASSGLTLSDVPKLADTARLLEAHFGGPQDIEWALGQDGRLYILQSRPMVFVKQEVEDPAHEIKISQEPILSGGSTAYPGVGAGPVFVVRHDSDLDRFPDRAVLVTHDSSPRLSLVMDRCAAILTEQGSPIGHMAILAREFRIPTIVGIKGAMAHLPEGQDVTVDAIAARIYDGIIAGVSPSREAPLMNAPAVQKLRRMAQYITPLQFYDATAPHFAPSNARSLHDIIRFVHEKVFEVMFYFGDRALALDPASLSLEENLPFRVLVFDVGGGLAEGGGSAGRIGLADVTSAPMKAFLSGLSDRRINWSEPRAISAGGFLSVLGESIAGLPAEELGVGRPSFAVISDRYMNFSTKAGYHFNTVDTYCGKNVNKNYIHFRFEGGAADEVRRARRCKFITIVLDALNFKVQSQGDVLVGRLERYDREQIQLRLVDLGRLTLCCRQLDMLMRSDSSPDFFAKAFLAGELERF
jgi:pyruvate,water dikinase